MNIEISEFKVSEVNPLREVGNFIRAKVRRDALALRVQEASQSVLAEMHESFNSEALLDLGSRG